MKYTKETIKILCNSLENLSGRINACKEAGIKFSTFYRWMNDERKKEFCKVIKKAEEHARQGLREKAVLCISRAMDEQWQAAAWWLERNYPREFGKDIKPIDEKEKDTTEVIFELCSNEPIPVKESSIEKSNSGEVSSETI
jgi:hypothetical protein